jgi:hypothetical protein
MEDDQVDPLPRKFLTSASYHSRAVCSRGTNLFRCKAFGVFVLDVFDLYLLTSSLFENRKLLVARAKWAGIMTNAIRLNKL